MLDSEKGLYGGLTLLPGIHPLLTQTIISPVHNKRTTHGANTQ